MAIEKARKNVLMPTTEVQGRLTAFHVVRTSEVSVDMSDTYPIEEWVNNRKTVSYGLSKPALMRIAQAAGITFDADRTGLVGAPTKDYVQYKAVAYMRLPDGATVTGVGTVEWFYDIVVQPILDEVEELRLEAESAQGEARTKALRRMHGKKRQAGEALTKRVPMVETKAMLRAIRQLLGIKGKYTKEELAAPFVVPRVDIVPDVADPYVRKLLATRALDITQALYGAPAGHMAQPQTALPQADDTFTQEFPTTYEDTFEEAVDGEPVDDEEDAVQQSFDDAVQAVADDLGAEVVETPDPADFVIADDNSTFKGKTLHEVEEEVPGYCRTVVKRGLGSVDLRDACLGYLEAYLPEQYVEVSTFE